jgi:hypothetical protein
MVRLCAESDQMGRRRRAPWPSIDLLRRRSSELVMPVACRPWPTSATRGGGHIRSEELADRAGVLQLDGISVRVAALVGAIVCASIGVHDADDIHRLEGVGKPSQGS